MVVDIQQESCVSSTHKQPSEESRRSRILTFDPAALQFVGRRVLDASKQRKYTKVGEDYNMCFKLVKNDSRLVKTLLFSYGFIQCSNKNQKCNLTWSVKLPLECQLHAAVAPMAKTESLSEELDAHQWQGLLQKKDQLYESIDRAAIQYGRDWFSFIPEFFCTPLSVEMLQSLRSKCSEIELGRLPPFIVKPAEGSLGRGISFLQNADQISSLGTDQKLLISRYIHRPLLVNGLKWDLRIYVLVTSFYPLIAYVYSDGLARFAVHKYADQPGSVADEFGDMNRHLTNYSLNKHSEEFLRNTDCTVENMGHKWTLGALLRDLEERGVDTELLMVRIEDIVIKSLLSVQGSVSAMCRKLNVHPKCCFELFGFDILVDEELKPFLLEANLSPSLTCDAPLDSLLKTHLLCNVLNIAQIPLLRESNGSNECYSAKPLAENGNSDEQSNSDRSSVCSSAQPQGNNVFGQRMAKRRIGISLQRNNKIRRIEHPPKITYSADRITLQYLERVKHYFEKLNSEEAVKGHFIRIFPRRMTWGLYSLIVGDGGQERWDEALHQRLSKEYASGGTPPEVTVKDIRTAHEQLMNASQFKRRDQLDPVVRDLILAEALREATFYKRKKIGQEGDVVPFPSALPKVRPNARRRTRSQILAEEVRNAKLEQIRRDRKADNPADGQAPLTEVSLNVQLEGLRKEDQQLVIDS